jgi:predicted dithiol-disulfide oxidoreductase (DUF899 family)
MSHKVVSKAEWDTARANLLLKEKAHTKQKDILSSEIRSLPWTKITKQYTFQTREGPQSLASLFAGRSQLFIQHHMFTPTDTEGCNGCAFWADQFSALKYHLPQRDVTFVVISSAGLEEIEKYKERMGWEFEWVSSMGSEFNRDMGVTTEEGERPGYSVFVKEGEDVYLTYFTTGRGGEVFNPTYAVLDLVPKGRNEGGYKYHPMEWVQHHDKYGSIPCGSSNCRVSLEME